MTMFPHQEWQGLVVGYLKNRKVSSELVVAALPAELFVGSSVHAHLIALRDEVISLDEEFKKKRNERDGIVASILGKHK
ncbi:hypothetical protein [Tardiphaga robiniae]|uniref:Uncharacterized protein n=1 Tax=Tardiphaga robiniae TaxID=943830 RepID=A0A7G6TXZ0_9BRAD|nr:hypothetical protein [Tardiphaga robiniae]QND71622.1 hypothetical protein HB776_10560 [Tardiphaga robiniae]